MIHRQGGDATGGLLKTALIDDGMGEAEGGRLNKLLPLLVELNQIQGGCELIVRRLTHSGIRGRFQIAPSPDLTVAAFRRTFDEQSRTSWDHD
jgi:hypothetical protein